MCEPIFERGFIFDSYANRLGKGTHRAVARYEKFRDRYRHVLRCDIYRYFPAIDHEILKSDLRRRIACQRTLDLADRIIDGSNPQEPVNQLFPGDDLLTPLQRRRGLPIGNLTCGGGAVPRLVGRPVGCSRVNISQMDTIPLEMRPQRNDAVGLGGNEHGAPEAASDLAARWSGLRRTP